MGHSNRRIDHLIIGGGAGGLAAINRLADKGIPSTMIEAGEYPAHKVCGEFFSFECHRILQEWDILPSEIIRSVRYHVGKEAYRFALPKPARGISRYVFDDSLYQRALSKGAEIFVKSSVKSLAFEQGEEYGYTIGLETGELFNAKTLYIGTGRVLNILLGHLNPPKIRYIGMKTHLQGLDLHETLEMFIVPGGYLGLSPIEGGAANAACLAEYKAVMKAGSPQKYLSQLDLGINLVSDEWMYVKVPEFHLSYPVIDQFPGLFLIGDAAAAIAPASGDGLAMAVLSGIMAVDCAFNEEGCKTYRKEWNKLFRNRLKWAKGIHWVMRHAHAAEWTLNLISKYPTIFNYLFNKTRS